MAYGEAETKFLTVPLWEILVTGFYSHVSLCQVRAPQVRQALPTHNRALMPTLGGDYRLCLTVEGNWAISGLGSAAGVDISYWPPSSWRS